MMRSRILSYVNCLHLEKVLLTSRSIDKILYLDFIRNKSEKGGCKNNVDHYNANPSLNIDCQFTSFDQRPVIDRLKVY
jgi:hypothetical protein